MGERALGRAQLHDAKRESGHRRKGMQLDRGAGRKERCERHGGLRIPLVIPGRPKAEPGIHSHKSSGTDAKNLFAQIVVMDSGLLASLGPGMTRSRDRHFIVGMTNSAPSLTPEGQRAVTVLVLV
jgi:hypothetical protein